MCLPDIMYAGPPTEISGLRIFCTVPDIIEKCIHYRKSRQENTLQKITTHGVTNAHLWIFEIRGILILPAYVFR